MRCALENYVDQSDETCKPTWEQSNSMVVLYKKGQLRQEDETPHHPQEFIPATIQQPRNYVYGVVTTMYTKER